MSITRAYLIIFILIHSISCDKNDRISNLKEEIEIGDSDKMYFFYQDIKIVGGYNQKESLDIDINKDNVNDFRVSCEIFGSPRMGTYPTITIKSLTPNSLVNGWFMDDTTFYSYQIDTTYDESISIYKIYYQESHSCQRVNEDDSIEKITPNTFFLKTFEEGESISKSDTYEYIENEYTLGEDWSKFYETLTPDVVEDTARIKLDYYYHNCYFIPNNEIRYIGIKVLENDREKIGWIKLKFINDYTLNILETAIQK